ncbi:hypothetical protein L1987_05816 [Smallanthus sonchifolius]|uniref:Uncharacterized protein n=1 Tax=Smallanthus sonchifolius TaxID=185202 RepID=A0ACB9JWN4_9ASTR|nr:hypothetical protein L1987_05816 [Smallanthus sonchifolius]
MDVDFIVSTGDNFYDNGLVDEDDPAFYDSSTNIYAAPSLQKQWYSILGNHDYRGNVLAQLSPALTQRDNKWLCMRSFILHADTDQEYDWRGVLPREEYISNLLKDVDVALIESSSKWKIVVGHHTIFSAGHHGNTQELVDKLLPILLIDLFNEFMYKPLEVALMASSSNGASAMGNPS